MRHATVLPPYWIRLSDRATDRHRIGGIAPQPEQCPNCEKDFMLYALLDLSAPELAPIRHQETELPLFYCMRCVVADAPFVYHLKPGNQMEVVKCERGPTRWDDWYSDLGLDVFPPRPFSLEPMPGVLQQFWDKLNADEALTADEENLIASMTGNYALPTVGSYPIVDVVNQVGGRAFMSQRIDDPPCCRCSTPKRPVKMAFLASLTNDPAAGMKITFDGVQIAFFLCPACATIAVISMV
jgi:hypothetical protein